MNTIPTKSMSRMVLFLMISIAACMTACTKGGDNPVPVKSTDPKANADSLATISKLKKQGYWKITGMLLQTDPSNSNESGATAVDISTDYYLRYLPYETISYESNLDFTAAANVRGNNWSDQIAVLGAYRVVAKSSSDISVIVSPIGLDTETQKCNSLTDTEMKVYVPFSKATTFNDPANGIAIKAYGKFMTFDFVSQ